MDRRQQESVIVDLVRSIGASLRNRSLYPPSHPLVRKPIEKSRSDLLLFFADRDDLVLVITDGTLVFEGVPLFSLTSSLERFMDRLARIGAPAVIFHKGLGAEELEAFIRYLHETTDAGLPADRIQERLDGMGIRNIRVKPADEEDDLVRARRIYDNAVSAVASVLRDVREGRIPSAAESEQVVRDIGGMIKRNRDAMLALTLIKNFDEYTYNHSVNVAVLALALADTLSLTEDENLEVGMAGLLHDVGKTQLALDLIRKPGSLTPEEFSEIRKHPEEGIVLIERMPHIRPGSAYLVLEHHMRFDFQGYPARKPGYRRHAHSHIIPVADTYDALTTMRSYQRARPPLEALELMKKLSGGSLNPEIVDVLTRTMGLYPVGTMVRLATREVGVVTATAEGDGLPAQLIVLVDADGKPLPRPRRVEVDGFNRPGGADAPRVLCPVNPLLFPTVNPAAFLRLAVE